MVLITFDHDNTTYSSLTFDVTHTVLVCPNILGNSKLHSKIQIQIGC